MFAILACFLLLKKSVKIESGEIAEERYTFGAAEKYARIALNNNDTIVAGTNLGQGNHNMRQELFIDIFEFIF